MSRFRTEGEVIVASFSPEEKAFLSDVVPLLVGLTADDPATKRLAPPVYLADPESNDEWWRLMGPELAEAKSADRSVFTRMVGSDQEVILSQTEADAVLRVLNETRLVLGVRLGIEVEADYDDLAPDRSWILNFFGLLQEELMDELSRWFDGE